MLKNYFNALIFNGFALLAWPSAQAALNLHDAVHEALTHHPAVHAARFARNTEAYRTRRAIAGYLPSLQVRLLQAKENSENPSLAAANIKDRTLHRQENQVILEQLIFDGGNTTGRIREQRSLHQVAHHQFHATMQSVALSATTAYLNVIRHRKLVALANDNIKAHRETMKKVKRRFKGGAGRRVDVQLARARLSLALSRLDKARGDLRSAEANYLAAIGHYPPRMMITPMLNGHALPPNLKVAVDIARNNNPTLKAAAASIEAAHQSTHIAKAPFWPRLALQLSATRNRELDGLKGPDRDKMAAVVLNYNLYNGGGDLAGYRAARTRYYESQAQAHDTLRRVKQNLRNSWHTYKRANNQVQDLRQYANASLRVVEDYKTQFLLGQRALFNVLDAENELFIARSNVTNAVYDRAIAFYQVFGNMGRLMDVIDTNMSE